MSLSEDRFREQYQELDDETLRRIAAGDVPWSDDAHFVTAARRAARDVLIARGVAHVPRVPWIDLDAARVPSGWRAGVVGGAIIVGVGLILLVGGPVDPRSDAAASDATTELVRLLSTTSTAQRLGLEARSCRVRWDEARSDASGGSASAPIACEVCTSLSARTLATLQSPRTPDESRDAVVARQLLDAPVTGRHCSTQPRVLGEVITTEGRTFWVRIRAIPCRLGACDAS